MNAIILITTNFAGLTPEVKERLCTEFQFFPGDRYILGSIPAGVQKPNKKASDISDLIPELAIMESVTIAGHPRDCAKAKAAIQQQNMTLKVLTTRYNKGGPIALGNQPKHGKWHVLTDPEALAHNQGTLQSRIAEQPQWEQLAERLLNIGGTVVCSTYDEDLQLILKKGRTWTPLQKDILMMPGERSRCHDNVGFLQEANPHLQIWMGYALSNDGIWRSHSWCINPITQTVVETTLKRVAYHGAHLP